MGQKVTSKLNDQEYLEILGIWSHEGQEQLLVHDHFSREEEILNRNWLETIY